LNVKNNLNEKSNGLVTDLWLAFVDSMYVLIKAPNVCRWIISDGVFFRRNVILQLENIKKNAKSKRQWWYWFNWTLIYSAFGSSKWNCYSEFCISYVRGEPYPFFNGCAFQNSNWSERRSFQIMRFWQMISKWLGITYRDWCGNKMGWIWCFLLLSLKFHQEYCQFHVQQPNNFKNIQSFACNLTSFESKFISKALGVNILSKW
jgi:hypothetical protein